MTGRFGGTGPEGRESRDGMNENKDILVIRYLPKVGAGSVEVLRRTADGNETLLHVHQYSGVENWVPEVRPVLTAAIEGGTTGVVVDIGEVD